MNEYLILFPDNHGDDWDEAYKINGYDPEDAIRDLCVRRYSDWEYPDGPLEFQVRDIETGIVTQVNVTIDVEPVFYANIQKHTCRRPHGT